jgi:hypothetical protein
VDDAGAKLEARAEPVYHSFLGKDADELTLAPFTQNSGHPSLLLIEGTQECLSYRPFILEKHCRQLAIFIVSTR